MLSAVEHDQGKGKWAYETITLGSPSVFICDNNSFQDLSKLLKIPSHGIPLSLPSQTTNKDFRKSCVIVLPRIITTHHLKLPWLRHGKQLRIHRYTPIQVSPKIPKLKNKK